MKINPLRFDGLYRMTALTSGPYKLGRLSSSDAAKMAVAPPCDDNKTFRLLATPSEVMSSQKVAFPVLFEYAGHKLGGWGSLLRLLRKRV